MAQKCLQNSWRFSPLDVQHYNDTPDRQILEKNIRRIEDGLDGNPKGGHIVGGFLEKILLSKAHPAYDALVWKNFKFTLSTRKSFKYSDGFQAINAPLSLNPELVDQVAIWMTIPKFVIDAARKLSKEQDKEKASSMGRGRA